MAFYLLETFFFINVEPIRRKLIKKLYKQNLLLGYFIGIT